MYFFVLLYRLIKLESQHQEVMEKVYPGQAPVINYANVLVAYRFREDEVCRHTMAAHSLVYVYSGKLTIVNEGKACVLSEGECAFLARNFKLEMSAVSCNGKKFSGVFLVLDRKFLMRYYQCFDKSKLPPISTRRLPNVSKLHPNLHIDSLFGALSVFFSSGEYPTAQYMELKQVEAADCLTGVDNRFCVTLFDFVGVWKTDILDFMENSYKEELTLEEMALYTGRSLAAFKRDFSQVSKDSPGRWVTKRRLQEAHRLIADEAQKPNAIYLQLGFKSLSHFSTAFKRQYNETPSELFNKLH